MTRPIAPAIATLPLAGSVVDIRAHDKTLQLCLRDDGWRDGAPGSAARPWINRFCTTATPAELRAIADAVEALLPGGLANGDLPEGSAP
jgi:hypothetical protein